MHRILAVLTLVSLAGCPSDKAAESPTPDTPAAVAAPTEPVPPPKPEYEPADLLATGVAVVRRTASDDKRIDDPEGKSEKKVSNFVAMIHRGEAVVAVGEAGEWLEVELRGGTSGFAKAKDFVPNDEPLSRAVVFEETRLFKRPDISALSDKKIEAGSLLYVGEVEGDFSEVNYPTGFYSARKGWVRTSDLQGGQEEFIVAEMLSRARYLTSKKDPHASALTLLARERFKDTQLVSLMPEIIEEAPLEETAEGSE